MNTKQQSLTKLVDLGGEEKVDVHCPLCTEEMTIAELAYPPCKCGYAVCTSCLQLVIAPRHESKCPLCRQEYDMDWLTQVKAVRIQEWVRYHKKDLSEADQRKVAVNLLKKRQAELLFISAHMRDKETEERKQDELKKQVELPVDQVPIMSLSAIRVYSEETISETFKQERKLVAPLFDIERPRSAPSGKTTTALQATYRQNKKEASDPSTTIPKYLGEPRVLRTKSAGPKRLEAEKAMFSQDLLQHVRAHSDFVEGGMHDLPIFSRHVSSDQVLMGDRYHPHRSSYHGRFSLTDDSIVYTANGPMLYANSSSEGWDFRSTPSLTPTGPKVSGWWIKPKQKNVLHSKSPVPPINTFEINRHALAYKSGKRHSNIPLTPPSQAKNLPTLDDDLSIVRETAQERPAGCCVIL